MGNRRANKGVSNTNSTTRRKTIKIDIKYDIIRTNKQARNNKHIHFDIKQLRANAIQLQRDPTEIRKIQKPIKTRSIYRKIHQKLPNTPEPEKITAKDNAARSNKTWSDLTDILRKIQKMNSRSMKTTQNAHD